MLITFSGIVGSGKSRGAKQVLALLTAWGYTPYYLRFRFIRWCHVFFSPVRKPWPKRHALSHTEAPHVPVNKQMPKRACSIGKRLSFLRFLGYWLLIMRFRLVMAVHFRKRLVVLSRYFYDSLASFNVSTEREHKYLRWLFAAVPKPNLAFLMVIRPETAWQRRPAYAGEDLQQLAENYAALRKYQNDLAVIATDNVHLVANQIEQATATVFHCPSLPDAYGVSCPTGSAADEGEDFDKFNLGLGI
jgi:thymidylate kinase